jgi:hypothetical protein
MQSPGKIRPSGKSSARAVSGVFTTLFARDFTFSITLTDLAPLLMLSTYPQA